MSRSWLVILGLLLLASPAADAATGIEMLELVEHAPGTYPIQLPAGEVRMSVKGPFGEKGGYVLRGDAGTLVSEYSFGFSKVLQTSGGRYELITNASGLAMFTRPSSDRLFLRDGSYEATLNGRAGFMTYSLESKAACVLAGAHGGPIEANFAHFRKNVVDRRRISSGTTTTYPIDDLSDERHLAFEGRGATLSLGLTPCPVEEGGRASGLRAGGFLTTWLLAYAWQRRLSN